MRFSFFKEEILMFSKKIFVAAAFFISAHVFAQLPDFTGLVEKVGKAVVNISTTQTVESGARLPFGNLEGEGPAFEFFKRFFPEDVFPEMPRQFQNKSLGSGFIISADGYILTNAHVVDEADEITVRLTDKREFQAKVIGSDKRTDVALLKIEAKDLPVVKQAATEEVKVGEWVVAIGSPFGFDNSVTAGIISALGRSLPQDNYVPFIQTDVAINPGNSGGPLFNMQGEVVGINSQIYSRSGGYMGVSFAIPMDVAMDVQKQLRQKGKVSRGRLGVIIQDITAELAESLGLKSTHGALVSMVEKNGPSMNLLEAGDVIVQFNGKAIQNSADLPRLVASNPPNSSVTLGIWRQGKTRDVAIKLGEMTESEPRGRAHALPKKGENNRLGLVLSPLTENQKARFGIQNGLVVEDLRGAASASNLRRGDIILALIYKGKQTATTTISNFAQLVDSLPQGDAFTLLVRRGEMQIFVTLRESKK